MLSRESYSITVELVLFALNGLACETDAIHFQVLFLCDEQDVNPVDPINPV